ncbi:transglycosylase SLT domain-containing protein [Hydrogenophaga atypica]|uniref:Transglycosylase SLT domain-containing protein n=1 Tax=Hydrogenophaga atypica TaxID=249409 RepID=A0ABW2QPX5_9BURK
MLRLAPRPCVVRLDRRCVIQGLAVACCLPQSFGSWAQTKVIQPTLTGQDMVRDLMPQGQEWSGLGYKRVEAANNTPTVSALTQPVPTSTQTPRANVPQAARGNATPISQPPLAYRRTADAIGVPAWILYGVALQESVLKFGRLALPYPWTLCVRGQGQRFASYEQALSALKRHLSQGITNVDCGAMQVNWHWHKQRLVSLERALDPYPNLAIGAQILAEHFSAHRNWFRAVALYHAGSINPANRARATGYAQNVVRHLQRQGVDTRRWFDGVTHV